MIYFEKARELGELLLDTEKAKRLARAKAAYEADEKAAAAFENYNLKRSEVQAEISRGKLSKEEYTEALREFALLAEELKKDPLILEFSEAEAEFYALVSQTLEIIKATVTGEQEDGCGGECGGCSGCK